MNGRDSLIFNILCYLWVAALAAVLITTLPLSSPAIVIFAVVLFFLLDFVMGKWGYAVKPLVILLILHRTFYIGPFFNSTWLQWLWTDVQADIANLLQRGLLNHESVVAMLFSLVVIAIFQSLKFAFISRRRGVLWLLFAGVWLLTSVWLWSGAGSGWYIFIYVTVGLPILATTRVQSQYSFSHSKWLSMLLVLTMILTSTALALPGMDLDVEGLYFRWEQSLERWRTDDETKAQPVRRQVGYSSFAGELGNPLEEDDTVALLVYAPRPVYLRGESKDQYTGRGWNDTIAYNSSPFAPLELSGFSGQQVDIQVEVRQLWSKVVFVPRYPLDIEPAPLAFVPVYYGEENPNGDFELHFSQHHPSGRSYFISALLVEDDPEVLRQTRSAIILSYFPMASYLQLPNGLPRRVSDLARDITADEENNYDRVMALVRYLRTNYSYSLAVESIPPGRDLVDFFLFEMDQGYCVHFSSALAVMARSIGIPARWVTGFLPGRPGSEGQYIVENGHAHSWVEIWFNDYGWVPFDPTPGTPGTSAQQTGRVPGQNEPGEQPDPGQSPQPDPVAPNPGDIQPEPEPAPVDASGELWPVLVGILTAFGLLLLITALALCSKPMPLPQVYARVQRSLRWFGWHRNSWETPREHWARIEDVLPDQAWLGRLIVALEGMVYGNAQPDAYVAREAGRRLSWWRLAVHRWLGKTEG